MQVYYSIAQETETETVIHKSLFIAKAVPINSEKEAKTELDRIRLRHREANHNVFAYRLGRVERFSDDGEPSGTAGRPVLEVLRKAEINNVLVVVTRYFGGILLGAGGLVRAYRQSAKSGLDQAGRVKLVPYARLKVVMDYTWLNLVQYEAQIRGYLQETTEYTQQVETTYLVPLTEMERFREHLIEIAAGQLRVEPGELLYRAEKL